MGESKVRLVGVAGGSGAGKSTLIRCVRNALPIETAELSMDDYYSNQSHLPFERRIEVDYDSLDAVDVSLFLEHLDMLREGHTISAPQYDFARHTRAVQTNELTPTPVVFLDGIMLLAVREIRERLTLSVFIQLDEEVRFRQRADRDLRERGRTMESVREQWDATVQPAYRELVEPSARHADLVVQSQDFEKIARVLCGEMLGLHSETEA